MYDGERHFWYGQSGKSYAYRITPFPVYMCDIPEINGNFIFTRQEKNSVEPIDEELLAEGHGVLACYGYISATVFPDCFEGGICK